MLQTPAFFLACILCVIAAVGLTRVYDAAPPQAIGLTVAAGTLLLLILTRFNKVFRGRVDSIGTEQLICVHAIRAPIGAAFLVLASEGLLPDLFANRAGYGDMFTAISGVLCVACCAGVGSASLRKTVYIVWNLVGLTDLLLAVGTGIYLAMTIPDSMALIARLPLLLVPTFILPILFATHLVMLRRLTKSDNNHAEMTK